VPAASAEKVHTPRGVVEYARGMAARPARCRLCLKPRAANRVISKRGLCPKCGEKRLSEQLDQMTLKSGPHYEHWVRGMGRRIDLLRQQLGD
jgi:hypothetical protein